MWIRTRFEPGAPKPKARIRSSAAVTARQICSTPSYACAMSIDGERASRGDGADGEDGEDGEDGPMSNASASSLSSPSSLSAPSPSSAPLPPASPFRRTEDALAVAILAVMTALPLLEIVV